MIKKFITNYWWVILLLPIIDYGVISNFYDIITLEWYWLVVVFGIFLYANIGLFVHMIQFIIKNK